MAEAQFRFLDLFAGIGGFHAALHGIGGRCVQAVEKDPHARSIYEKAWLSAAGPSDQFVITGDVNDLAPLLPMGSDDRDAVDEKVADHDVLAAGFPCQAFSKSGLQRGVLDETRGTLFYNVLRIVEAKRPKIVFLENVRNLVGPRHRSTTFATIVRALEESGYFLSRDPLIISPHRISPEQGGAPQVRDRVFILAIRKDLVDLGAVQPFTSPEYGNWDPSAWDLASTPLPASGGRPAMDRMGTLGGSPYHLRRDSPEYTWISAYDSFLRDVMDSNGMTPGDGRRRLPGFPLWFGQQLADRTRVEQERSQALERGLAWKVRFIDENLRFYGQNSYAVERLRRTLQDFPESRKKLEWQAADASSLWECLVQLRPSGVRVKPPNYAPALVAINQAPIFGPEVRRITPREASRLQGFPEWFSDVLATQDDKESYKQLGNAVHVGSIQFALKQWIAHLRPGLSALGRRDPAVGAILRAATTT